MTLINVLKGEDFGYDPTALDGFSTTAAVVRCRATSVRRWRSSTRRSRVVVAGFNVYVTPYWPTWRRAPTVDPVSAVLMHNNVYNEFVLDMGTKSGTDWVVTLPDQARITTVGRRTRLRSPSCSRATSRPPARATT